MFRLLLGHLQALKRKQIQELSIFQCIVGSQMLTDYIAEKKIKLSKTAEALRQNSQTHCHQIRQWMV